MEKEEAEIRIFAPTDKTTKLRMFDEQGGGFEIEIHPTVARTREVKIINRLSPPFNGAYVDTIVAGASITTKTEIKL
jgi:hypothetical protein